MTAAALAAMLLLAAAPGQAAPAAEAAPTARPAAPNPPTVVTSDRLDVDYANNIAVFAGSVHLKDKSGEMWADEMTVTFDNVTREVREIVATGRQVVIDAHGRKSVSRRASYTAADGRILLTGEPKILHGPNAYTADKITIFKDQDRTIFEPRARMFFYSDQGSGVSDALGGLPGTRGAGD